MKDPKVGVPQIAIVDDNSSVLRAMDRMIRSLGMESRTYASAQQFMSELECSLSAVPDCLILDIQMPGMTGLELQEHLAAREPAIPIIMISAHDDPSSRQQALDGGAIAFLRKPFKDDLLISTLNEALESSTS